jgi:hypothetical protein
MDGVIADALKDNSFPYAVPALFVAYALTLYVVPGCKPVRLLEKLPVPVPSLVKLLLMVGFEVVAQQTPLAVIDPPPSDVIFPPDTAVAGVIEVIVLVDIVATTIGLVLKETSLPYPVPVLFVA